MEKPKTQKEQIDQLWMLIIGSNGDGLKNDLREIKSCMNDIKDNFNQFQINREETCPVVNRRYKNWPLIISGLSMLIAATAIILNVVVR